MDNVEIRMKEDSVGVNKLKKRKWGNCIEEAKLTYTEKQDKNRQQLTVDCLLFIVSEYLSNL